MPSAEFVQLGVEMTEQPLRRGADEQLEFFRSPTPLSVDESCLHAGELEQAARRYQMINIKLDKSGGALMYSNWSKPPAVLVSRS